MPGEFGLDVMLELMVRLVHVSAHAGYLPNVIGSHAASKLNPHAQVLRRAAERAPRPRVAIRFRPRSGIAWHASCVRKATLHIPESVTPMKTADLMTRNVAACQAHDSLEQIARLMWDRDVGCVVVTDNQQKPIGMITDRDLAMAAYTQGALLRDIRVETVMARNIWTCSVNTSLKEVEAKMRTAQVRRIPVVGFDGELVGIVTLGDIARSAQSSPLHVAELPGLARTLASVTERRWGESAVAH